MRNQETLGTIWDVTEEFWERIEPIILEKDPNPRPEAARGYNMALVSIH